jgi:hypothetical protein
MTHSAAFSAVKGLLPLAKFDQKWPQNACNRQWLYLPCLAVKIEWNGKFFLNIILYSGHY